jgi:hypothetical protein
MYGSKLVAGAGQRLESARRLSILLRFAAKTSESKEVSAPRPTLPYCIPLKRHYWSNGGGRV